METASSVKKASISSSELGTKATFGVVAGMIYGGCREAYVGFTKEETVLMLKHAVSKDPLERRNLLREMMELKALRVARGTAVGGAKLGLFTALFCAIEQYLTIERNVRDTQNVVVAASVTTGALGLLTPGSLRMRLTTGLLGSAMGASLGVPLGLLQTALYTQIHKESAISVDPSAQNAEKNGSVDHDAVGDAIQRLEERLSQE